MHLKPEMARIIEVNQDGLKILIDSRREGFIPLNEIFIEHAHPIVLKERVFLQHVCLALRQTIPVLQLDNALGTYSRKRAIEYYLSAISENDIISVTIMDIDSRFIYGLADQGINIRLPRFDTENELQKRFGPKRRLDNTMEEEGAWFYAQDRIKVKVKSGTAYILNGYLVIGDDKVLASESLDFTPISDHPCAPSTIYNSVIIAGPQMSEDDPIPRYFRDGHYLVQIVSDLLELPDVILQVRYRGHQENIPIVLIQIGGNGFTCDDVLTIVPYLPDSIEIILFMRTWRRLENDIQDEVNVRKNILGIWHEPFGYNLLDSMLLHQSFQTSPPLSLGDISSVNFAKREIDNDSVRQNNVSYNHFKEDCHSILETLLEGIGDGSKPMAAILFQIHKKSHTVAIVSKAGDEQIYNGFNNYLADLHKSPIRDLAIYGEAADIGDAKSEPGRYIYFLDAIGWPNEKTLSVLGFRPSSPAGDHLAYAGFVFSRKLDAFKEICMLKQLRSSAERAIGVALIAQALDARLARMKRKAELSTDFQFLAHEANYFLKRPADLLDKMQDERQLSWEDFRLVIGYLNRSRRAMNIFLHWDDVVDNELNPGEVSMELADTIRKEWDLPQTLQLEVNVDREVEQTFQARRLAYESVLRNLLLNAVQQIQDYCKNSGRVVVDLKLRKAKGEPLTLVTMVRDNGPGIHAKYKNSIFDSEFTTRASGTGFGLTLSRDLITKAQGTLELKDSFIYGGTTFELTLPISRLPHTKS